MLSIGTICKPDSLITTLATHLVGCWQQMKVRAAFLLWQLAQQQSARCLLPSIQSILQLMQSQVSMHTSFSPVSVCLLQGYQATIQPCSRISIGLHLSVCQQQQVQDSLLQPGSQSSRCRFRGQHCKCPRCKSRAATAAGTSAEAILEQYPELSLRHSNGSCYGCF